MRKAIFILSFGILIFSGCRKETKESNIPSIELVSASPLNIIAFKDENIDISFSFKDGDGDIGANSNQPGDYNIFVRDTRVDSVQYKFNFPDIQSQISQPEKGISGIAAFPFNGALLPLDSTKVMDSLQLEIYIIDGAGHESNKISTPNIFLNR